MRNKHVSYRTKTSKHIIFVVVFWQKSAKKMTQNSKKLKQGSKKVNICLYSLQFMFQSQKTLICRQHLRQNLPSPQINLPKITLTIILNSPTHPKIPHQPSTLPLTPQSTSLLIHIITLL